MQMPSEGDPVGSVGMKQALRRAWPHQSRTLEPEEHPTLTLEMVALTASAVSDFVVGCIHILVVAHDVLLVSSSAMSHWRLIYNTLLQMSPFCRFGRDLTITHSLTTCGSILRGNKCATAWASSCARSSTTCGHATQVSHLETVGATSAGSTSTQIGCVRKESLTSRRLMQLRRQLRLRTPWKVCDDM